MSFSLLPLGAFILVIALIPLALKALKRAGVGGANAAGILRPVANLGVGPAQRVSVVEVAVGAERHWLVLGITGEQVTNLATYAAPDAASMPPAATPGVPAAGGPAHVVTVQQLIARWRESRGPKGE